MYSFRIEKCTVIDDDHCDVETLVYYENISFINALEKLEAFVVDHPDGYLNDIGGYTICYSTENSELEAIIELEEDKE